ncbi:hypothetical protein DSO57_1024945 [Entomophthora muscae]|uniref:Uncharacterized protein n=1 Tax=Entomophthora muscae TaxID=34485 RepID=A0ACC2UNA7_9FUNG|nr:hypothetical protein DSO57_1024945 [Entomophthora muscae]
MGPSIWNFVVGAAKCQFHTSQFCSSSPILETENCVTSQCPEFYAEDALMLSQVIYLGLLWLGLIVLLNPGVTIGNFTKKIYEAALVVNHQFYVDLGGNSSSFRNGFILSNDFHHSLCICQVPEPMWVATVSGRLKGPAAVWFTNWASQELDVTWAAF